MINWFDTLLIIGGCLTAATVVCLIIENILEQITIRKGRINEN